MAVYIISIAIVLITASDCVGCVHSGMPDSCVNYIYSSLCHPQESGQNSGSRNDQTGNRRAKQKTTEISSRAVNSTINSKPILIDEL